MATKSAEDAKGKAAQQVLAEEGDADGGELDSRLAHEVDAEEGHQRHAGGDRDEICPDYDGDAFI